MEGRWVCNRCFESNEASAFSCVKCGLLRGATPPVGDTSWQPAPGTPGAPMPGVPQPSGFDWGGLLRRFGWLPVVVIIAAAGYYFSAQRGDAGQITQSGNMAVTDLRAGDCFNLNDQNAETHEQVNAVPCSETHQFEMFYVQGLPDGDFPGADAFLTFVDQNCVPEFGAFVGRAYAASRYDIFWFEPSPDSWGAGDRTIQCAAFDPLNSSLTGTLRAAAE